MNTIEDIKCPRCGGINTYIYGTDELDFGADGTGQYRPDVYCKDCERGFRPFYYFKYEIYQEYNT